MIHAMVTNVTNTGTKVIPAFACREAMYMRSCMARCLRFATHSCTVASRGRNALVTERNATIDVVQALRNATQVPLALLGMSQYHSTLQQVLIYTVRKACSDRQT